VSEINHIVAIDLGSNSFHLVIAKEHNNAITLLESHKERISLGSGLDDTHNLSSEAIERGINCLKVFSQRFNLLPFSRVRVVATHTLRKAANSNDFIKAAKSIFPYPIEIVDGHTEAELIYSGVAHTQPLRGRTLVIDIGGGSTELIIGKGFSANLTDSLELGSGQLTKQFFSNNEITEQSFEQAYQYALTQLSPIADRYRKLGWKSAIGTSGSIKLIQHVFKELNGSPKISLKRLRRLKKQLVLWGNTDNIPLTCVKTEKLDILASAVTILTACFDLLALEEINYSSAALREGVLYGLSKSRHDIDIRQRTVNNMCRLYHTDIAFSTRVTKQLNYFIKQLPEKFKINQDQLECLSWASQLHEIGLHINTKKRQKHAAYILTHSDMLGFNQAERELMILLVKYHRAKISLTDDLSLATAQNKLLISLFRLAVICTQGRLNLPLLAIEIGYSSNNLALILNKAHYKNSALITALTCEIEHIKKLDINMSLNDPLL
jgi:exopolyphosphatase/guanosine-5'-triphosphate,3'-diphosphate pyrophosphatase